MPTFVTRPGLHVEAAQPDPSLDVWSVEAGDLPPFALPGDRFRALFEPVESVPAAVDPTPPDLTALWYSDPAAVFDAMHEMAALSAGVSVEDLAPEVGCFDEDGNEFELSTDDLVAGLREQGCWGFFDARTQTIHAWVDPDCDPSLVVHMLAHEIGHAVDHEDGDAHAREMRAEQLGRVARMAWEFSQSAFSAARKASEGGEGS